jgi:uncharacterized protein involved in propanediol utilization
MGVIVFSKPKILDNPKWTEKPRAAAAINRRVEMLGKLNDRLNRARGAGDRAAMLEIASEYAALKCPRFANEIIVESDGLR